MSFEILEGGVVAAHTPSNVRIIDSARNWARGQRHTVKQAGLFALTIGICDNSLSTAVFALQASQQQRGHSSASLADLPRRQGHLGLDASSDSRISHCGMDVR